MEKFLLFGDVGKYRPKHRLRFPLLFVILALGLALPGRLAAQDSRITVEMKQATVEQAVDRIRETTGYRFSFHRQDLPTALRDFNFRNATIRQAMDGLLENTGLVWTESNGTIVISRAPQRTTQQAGGQIPVRFRGTVRDSDGRPLPGVTVMLTGTRNGTTTDAMGRFILQVPRDFEGDIRVTASSIGYKTKEFIIKPNTEPEVVLERDVVSIDDVVVTGYFDMNRETYTGSASRITAAEIQSIGSSNILQVIQTMEPSFRLVENIEQGSNPNALPDIELRGTGSFPGIQQEYRNNPNMPTFIIDGFEMSAQKVFDLDPNRILSITILKDAAATALYGSRSANGVVVIETKVPAIGKIEVNYKSDVKFTAADLSDYNLLTAAEKIEYEMLSGVYPGADRVSDMERNMDEYYQKLRLVAMGYNTDWLAQPVNGLAVAHKHSLQVEQGSQEFRYNLNFFYDMDNGVMKESYRSRMGIGAYFQYRYKTFIFMNDISYNRVVGNNSPYGEFSEYAKANPYIPFRDIDGKIVKYFEFVNTPNPLYNATIGVIDKDTYDEISNNFRLEWQATSSLKWKSSIAFSRKIMNDKLFLPAEHTIFRAYYNSLIGTEKDKAGTYRTEYGESFHLNFNTLLSYNTAIDEHYLTFNGGVEVSTQRGESTVYQVRGFPNSLLSYPSFGTSYDMFTTGSGGMKPDGYEDISRSIGFFATANYNWKNRYFVDFSGRLDASSKFGSNNRWAKFWSVGVGWNIHREDFMNNSRSLTQLRLRASTGFTGGQNFNPNQSLTMFDYVRNYYYQRQYAGARLTAMGNENLKWQRVSKNNIGLDIAFEKRFSATLEYYREISNDVVTPVTLPPSLGFQSYTENLGKVSNTGVEAKVNVGLINRNERRLYWSVFGSVSHNENKLLKISNALDAWNAEQDGIVSSNPKVRFIEGQDMKAIWVVPSLGIDPVTGKEIFLRRNSELTDVWYAEDQVVGGTQTPKAFGNVGTQFSYRQWQLNIYMLYSVGGDTYNQTLVSRVENADPLFNVDRRALEGRWKEKGDISRFKNIADRTITKPTSRFIEKNDYLRLTSFNLSYEFDREQIDGIGFKRLKLICYANDVFNISSVKQERGLSYPYARSFTITVQIGL